MSCLKILLLFQGFFHCLCFSYSDLIITLLKDVDVENILVVGDNLESLPDLTEVAQNWTLKAVDMKESKVIGSYFEDQEDKNLIIALSDDVKHVSDILLSIKAKYFIENIICVLGQVSVEEVMASYSQNGIPIRNRLGVNSQLYFIQPNTLSVTQVQGEANLEVIVKECGYYGSTCSLKEVIAETNRRLDHKGQTIRFSYEAWPPLVMINEDGSLDGLMPNVAVAVTRMLNLTPEYIRIRDPSGWRLPNGTWTGDLADVGSGFVDAGIWGYIITMERLEVVDFTHKFGKFKFGVLVKRPSSTDVSMENYVMEFHMMSWICILLGNLGYWSLFFILLNWGIKNGNKSIRISKNLATTVIVMLRTLINKASGLNATSISLRCGYFTLLMMSMLFLMHYRATMNAFLNERDYRLPIDSYEDLLSSPLDLIINKGTFTEQLFAFAPAGTILHEIFEKKLRGKKRLQDYGGLAEGLKLVAQGKAIMYRGIPEIVFEPAYPCKLVDTRQPSSMYQVAIVLPKDSPLLEPFNRAVLAMFETGALQRSFLRHTKSPKEFVVCEPDKTNLGLYQTFFPFVCLMVGICIAIISTLIEKLPTIARRRREVDRFKREVLFAHWDMKKYDLSNEELVKLLKQ